MQNDMGGSTRPHLVGLPGAVAVHMRVEARAAELAHPVAQVVAAQVKFESKLESGSSTFSFKRFVLGAFNAGLIGSTCTALPGRSCGMGSCPSAAQGLSPAR